MSLGRAWGWSPFLSLLILLTAAAATVGVVTTATRHQRRQDLSYFNASYDNLPREVSNNLTASQLYREEATSAINGYSYQHQHQHHHHHQHHNHHNHYHRYQQHQLQQQPHASNGGGGIGLEGPLRVPHLRHHHVSHRGPYFENAEGLEINGSRTVVHLGDTALLDCRVVMLSGKMVMWIRQSPDRALLTVGKDTHIADLRYSVKFKYPNNWRLAISSIQKEDRGLYVCQVNTHPPKMLVTNVTILAPEIKIVDEAKHELRDRYYKTGSVIELTCKVRPSRLGSKVPHPVWKKNGETLPDHISVYHSNGSDGGDLSSRLRVEQAKKSDSGEFSCTISQFSTTLVNIHVVNGEKQAAVHHDQWNAAQACMSRQSSGLAALSGVLLVNLLLSLGSIGYPTTTTITPAGVVSAQVA